MPTYQYKCPECDNEFEEFQNITEQPLSKCPQCGGKPRRIITGGAGFILKGSGFYATDYRSESYKAAARKDIPTPPSSSGTKKADKKADKKKT
ncbi:MAG: zinc ribbon domain-containing protein [FCB group bacterium]|nr:zinc ribbon domain-containing protein [FCB group bacterium]